MRVRLRVELFDQADIGQPPITQAELEAIEKRITDFLLDSMDDFTHVSFGVEKVDEYVAPDPDWKGGDG